MKEKEIKILLKKLERVRKNLANSEQGSKDFLVKAGIITKKGNLKANYKHLCIPQEQV
ncbi:MAG TPA: hypothetical protein VFM60_00415 [Salinimicrobium sp.]|nr:hypothetical protein [Salinimicrobium sp.]